MKKILACILLTAAMIGLWGCAGEAAPPQTAQTPNETSAAAEIPSETAAAAESTAGETLAATVQRSEERRVGKECRSRWSPYP